ncbi:MAG: acyl-CoA/acyl-ACP dehydrogenase, partial [Planctomycetales bacterium]|nr:acyl-CoA/acyl-ACP dehydrogenase [Planctomycetales bacterium]
SVQCDDLKLSDEDVLGTAHDGLTDILANLTQGRLYIASGALGVIDLVLAKLGSWMAERKTGQTPLNEITSLQEKRSEIFIAQTAANAMIAQIAGLDPTNRETQALATAAKIYATDQAHWAAYHGAIIHGGSGVVRETAVARAWVDSMVYIVGEGSNPTLHYQLGRHLNKHASL